VPKSTITITYRDANGVELPITREIAVRDAGINNLQLLHKDKPADYFQKVADAVNNAQRQVSVTIPVKLDDAALSEYGKLLTVEQIMSLVDADLRLMVDTLMAQMLGTSVAEYRAKRVMLFNNARQFVCQ